MPTTPKEPAEVDAVLDHICLALVSLARTLEAGAAFRGLMDAAYQVEQARSTFLEELAAAGEGRPGAGEDIDEESSPGHDHTPSFLERHNEVSITLHEIEQYLAGLTAEIERTVPMKDRNIYTYFAAESAVKALAQLRYLLADTQRG